MRNLMPGRGQRSERVWRSTPGRIIIRTANNSGNRTIQTVSKMHEDARTSHPCERRARDRKATF